MSTKPVSKGTDVAMLCMIILLLFSCIYVSINYQYKNEVILFKAKGLSIDGGLFQYALYGKNNFIIKVVIFLKLKERKKMTSEQIQYLDDVISNSTLSSLVTCDINACIVCFNKNYKIDKIVLLTCNGTQLVSNKRGNIDVVLLNEDQSIFFYDLLNN
jgi:hypothetical protein